MIIILAFTYNGTQLKKNEPATLADYETLRGVAKVGHVRGAVKEYDEETNRAEKCAVTNSKQRKTRGKRKETRERENETV